MQSSKVPRWHCASEVPRWYCASKVLGSTLHSTEGHAGTSHQMLQNRRPTAENYKNLRRREAFRVNHGRKDRTWQRPRSMPRKYTSWSHGIYTHRLIDSLFVLKPISRAFGVVWRNYAWSLIISCAFKNSHRLIIFVRSCLLFWRGMVPPFQVCQCRKLKYLEPGETRIVLRVIITPAEDRHVSSHQSFSNNRPDLFWQYRHCCKVPRHFEKVYRQTPIAWLAYWMVSARWRDCPHGMRHDGFFTACFW